MQSAHFKKLLINISTIYNNIYYWAGLAVETGIKRETEVVSKEFDKSTNIKK